MDATLTTQFPESERSELDCLDLETNFLPRLISWDDFRRRRRHSAIF